VRELENMVQRALAMAEGPELTVEDFMSDLGDPRATAGAGLSDSASLDDDLKEERRRRILDALSRCDGNQSQAARLLGMPRRTLVERLREYGVTRKRKLDIR
jgi:DNA-binding NtrC family response regulator